MFRDGRLMMGVQRCLFTMTLCTSLSAYAGTSPIDVIKKIDNEINNPILQKSEEILNKVTDKYFDFQEFTKLSFGLHWDHLSKAESEEFVGLFAKLLKLAYVHNYVHNYINYHYKIISLEEKPNKNMAQVTANFNLFQRGNPSYRQSMKVTYEMEQKDGSWVVYDIITDDLALSVSYRSQIYNILSKESPNSLREKLKRKILALQEQVSK